MQTLENDQLSVKTFQSWYEAALELENTQPDLIFLDAILQGINGHEVVPVFGERCDAPIDLFSNLPRSIIRGLVRESRSNGYLPKLLLKKYLYRHIEEGLKKVTAN
jgi:DNA-binding response OmpR family regulator